MAAKADPVSSPEEEDATELRFGKGEEVVAGRLRTQEICSLVVCIENLWCEPH